MRLIDADALIEDFKKQLETATNPFFAIYCDFCISHLDKQPTAYDVEAVVAELEKRVNEVPLHGFAYEDDDHDGIYNDGLEDGYMEAIEIVRGKEEDTLC